MADTRFQGHAGTEYTYHRDTELEIGVDYLHLGVMSGDVDFIHRCHRANFPLDDVDREGNTALILACRYSMTKCAKALLEYGANPNTAKEGNASCLFFACERGNIELVQLLLLHGAKPTENSGKSFFTACRCNYVGIVQLFVAHQMDVNYRMPDQSTALHIAAEHCHIQMVSYLASLGTNVNAQRDDGSTPLLLACNVGCVAMVRELLRHNVFVDMPKNNSVTPIYIAAKKGHANIVSVLLEHGAKHHLMTKGETPIHAASRKGHIKVVRALIAGGADPDIKDRLRDTALLKAEKFKNVPVIKFLQKLAEQKRQEQLISS